MDLDKGILKNEETISLALRSLYARYGYVQYRMSRFEEYELYVSNKDFLISSDVITFTDTNGRLMALKPDVTLSIVRGARFEPGTVQKLYYDEAVYRTLRDIEFAKYHVYPQGYMVRISPESYREQVRVSREAVRKGISFQALGNSYITEYKKNPNVINATVIFLTDPAADYAAFKALAKKSADVTGTLTHIFEGLPTDCSVCALKDICDEVEGMKELHFGVGDKGSSHKH